MSYEMFRNRALRRPARRRRSEYDWLLWLEQAKGGRFKVRQVRTEAQLRRVLRTGEAFFADGRD